MYQLRRAGQIGYEDLMRELALIEHQLLAENNSAAMDLMVIEAKLRDRFRRLEKKVTGKPLQDDYDDLKGDDWTMEDIKEMIPQELAFSLNLDDLEEEGKKRKTWQTIGMAAFLAVVTALGVFGLASLLQIALSWLA